MSKASETSEDERFNTATLILLRLLTSRTPALKVAFGEREIEGNPLGLNPDPGTEGALLRNLVMHNVRGTDVVIQALLSNAAAHMEDERRVGGRPRGRRQAAQPAENDAVVEVATAIADNFLERLVEDSAELGKLDPAEADRLGRSAAEVVLASARWSRLVGERIDTSTVTTLLGVTRQALKKRQTAGSLLGLPGHGTTWFPTWQFDLAAKAIRPQVREIIGAFRDRLDRVDPLLIASWATTPQDEDLDGCTPARWLDMGGDEHRLRLAAERAASRLAR